MKTKVLYIFFTLYILVHQSIISNPSPSKEIVLTGYNLTIDDIVYHAKNKTKILIDSQSMERVKKSHEILLQAAKEDKPVYGLNRGVGQNKDKTLFVGDALSEEAKLASIAFNKNNLRATSSAVGPNLPEKIVFSIMLIKLNSILKGTTGASPEVATLLLEFINRRIQPIIPSRGSVGEADITILSHLGLALAGEGEVYFQGELMSASKALSINGLSPIVPIAKDSLSIMSSNAYSTALAALIIHDLESLMDKSDIIFSLSLEALNGNVAPYLKASQNARPYPGQKISANNIIHALRKSYLWNNSSNRALQDPLSFRAVSQVHGTVRDFIKSAKKKLSLHLNSSDDNPIVLINPDKDDSFTEIEKTYYLQDGSGAVVPTANFETINWAIEFEALAIALSHLSHASTQRMLRLSTDHFTHLSRFLSPDNESIVFGAIQKTFVTLDGEVKALSMPVSRDLIAVAGDIEDLSTNVPLVLQRLCKITDNIYYILGMELMHASQAIDLRKRNDPSMKLGLCTEKVYNKFREVVSFIEKDRSLSSDIERAYFFVAKTWPGKLVSLDCIFYPGESSKTHSASVEMPL